jgi:hypothetical protein
MCTAIHERQLGEPPDAFIEVTSAPHSFLDVCADHYC